MLCTWFDRSKLRLPCFVQPKLNGFRVVYMNGHLYSRNGHVWKDQVLAHLVEPIKAAIAPGTILDGELYRHGWSLERIAEALSFQRTSPSKDTLEVCFYVFDAPFDCPFEQRLKVYARAVQDIRSDNVQFVPALTAESLEMADGLHWLNLKAKFEGSIYRFGESGYHSGRSVCLMKRKEVRGSGFKEKRIFGERREVWGTL